MAINHKDIRSKRQWRASTGLSQDQFELLSEIFGKTYEDLFGETLEERQENSTNTSKFRSYKDLLFFGLYSIKSGLTFDLVALSFDISNSNAYSKLAIVLRILETTLYKQGLMPEREFNKEEDFKEFLKNEPTILIDVTEQCVQRAENKEQQRADYSGKKKPIP
jgi:hypothetical protein